MSSLCRALSIASLYCKWSKSISSFSVCITKSVTVWDIAYYGFSNPTTAGDTAISSTFSAPIIYMMSSIIWSPLLISFCISDCSMIMYWSLDYCSASGSSSKLLRRCCLPVDADAPAEEERRRSFSSLLLYSIYIIIAENLRMLKEWKCCFYFLITCSDGKVEWFWKGMKCDCCRQRPVQNVAPLRLVGWKASCFGPPSSAITATTTTVKRVA